MSRPSVPRATPPSKAPRPTVPRAPATPTNIPLSDAVTVVRVESDAHGTAKVTDRIAGADLARLLRFAQAWAPNWPAMLELEELIRQLRGLERTIHLMEEHPDRPESTTLHFLHETLGTLIARLEAATTRPAELAGYQVEVAS